MITTFIKHHLAIQVDKYQKPEYRLCGLETYHYPYSNVSKINQEEMIDEPIHARDGEIVKIKVCGDFSFTNIKKVRDTNESLYQCGEDIYYAHYYPQDGHVAQEVSSCLFKITHAQYCELLVRIHKRADSVDIYCIKFIYHMLDILNNVAAGRYISIKVPKDDAHIYHWLYLMYYQKQGVKYDVMHGIIHHPTKVLPRINGFEDCIVQFKS